KPYETAAQRRRGGEAGTRRNRRRNKDQSSQHTEHSEAAQDEHHDEKAEQTRHAIASIAAATNGTTQNQKTSNTAKVVQAPRSVAVEEIVVANVAVAPRSSVIMPRINRQRILVACQPVKIVTNKTGVPLHNSKIGNSRSNPIKKPPLKVRLCTSRVVVQQVRPPGPPIFGRLTSRYSNRVRPLLPVRRTNRKNRINQ